MKKHYAMLLYVGLMRYVLEQKWSSWRVTTNDLQQERGNKTQPINGHKQNLIAVHQCYWMWNVQSPINTLTCRLKNSDWPDRPASGRSALGRRRIPSTRCKRCRRPRSRAMGCRGRRQDGGQHPPGPERWKYRKWTLMLKTKDPSSFCFPLNAYLMP